MTKRQRARVVELLRCAADQMGVPHWFDYRYHYSPICDAALGLGLPCGGIHYPSNEEQIAMAAAADVLGGIGLGCSKDRVQTCLEAAARVEEGTWP